MADVFISIASTVSEYLVDILLYPLQYLTQYNNNVQDLHNQIDRLDHIKQRVNQSVEAAQRNGEEILPEVRKWISSVDEIIVEIEKFEDEIKSNKKCFSGLCPDWIFRYRVSKKSIKKKAIVAGLQEGGKFKTVSRPLPPPSIEGLLSGDFMVFDSTESTMNQIFEALKDDEINIVGVYGIRGVGKTALVNEVGKKAKQSNLFNEVVLGVVSETPNLRDTQGQIGDMLGLILKEESELGRAGRLYTRIKNEEKILVILDGIFASLDLNSLGIPTDHKGCKILLTTRNEHVSNAMGNRTKKIRVNELSEEESWRFFSRITGEVVDSSTFSAVAREVVRECRGLPLMLVTMGSRLRGKGIEEWRDAALQLRKSRETNEGKVGQDDFVNLCDYD